MKTVLGQFSDNSRISTCCGAFQKEKATAASDHSSCSYDGAEERIRTSTRKSGLGPEPSASANSATSAWSCKVWPVYELRPLRQGPD